MSHDESSQARRVFPSPSDDDDDASTPFSRRAVGGSDPRAPPKRTPTILQRWALRASDSQFNALAGALGGFTSGIVTCPLDVIKTKLQAQGTYRLVDDGRHVGHPKMYNGLVGTAKVIWRQEGVRGMYRGLGPIILGYLPTWAVWFTIYNKSKIWMARHSENKHMVSFCSSIIAGASSTIVTNPIWVIKTRLMSQSHMPEADHHLDSLYPKASNTPRQTLYSWHYRSTIDAARKMYMSEGLASFYSGLTPALLGLTHVAVQFPTYEFLKTSFTGQGMGAVPTQGESAHWLGILSASILSKILASSATYPHEVIRTRLQTQRRPLVGEHYLQGLGVSTPASGASVGGPKYRGIVMTFRTILREEGWRAFYAGLGTNMMRAVPAATVTMLTYEYVMRQLNSAKVEGRRLTEEA
ncbi:hypothetical protein CP533_0564 [Ophiocordyceps camponoti-saundersi (nom. inval.)]|nr:hypothetical protein CP533_0564 [Ophiocordyceps camponoti-saundersi (nom. inval.)]